MIYVFLIIASLNANADLLSDIFNYQDQSYNTEEPYQETQYDDTGPEHYSWDNLYLPYYAEPEEIIYNPYAE